MYILCIYIMETTIQKWGNSLAVRLPKEVTRKLALRAGRRVRVYEERREVVIAPEPEKPLSLRERVKMIRPEQLHKEFSWGDPVGKEIW